jgi:hypothetical protein
MTDLEIELWEERAAIMQYDAGLSCFEAETKAADGMGRKRWELVNAQRERNSASLGDRARAVEGQSRQNNVPGMQRGTAQKSRSVPERNAQAGWDRRVLSPLRLG